MRPQSAQRYRPQSASNNNRHSQKPVDFVYDIDVRKEIRAALDHERAKLLRLTKEREQALREPNLWLFDRRDLDTVNGVPTSPPKKILSPKQKQCWGTPRVTPREVPEKEVKTTVAPPKSPVHAAMDEIVWAQKKPTKKKERPKTAIGKRNSIAENVHNAERQTKSFHDNSERNKRQHHCDRY